MARSMAVATDVRRSAKSEGKRPAACAAGLLFASRLLPVSSTARAPVAQWIERRPPEPKVAGSNPVGRASSSLVAETDRAATLGGHKFEMGNPVILPKIRDPRFITVRRGGTLQDDDHRLLAVWATECAEHVLHHFEQARPKDDRPRRAIDLGRAWARGEILWSDARTAAGHANAAARDLSGAARHAAYAAGQAAAVGHVAAHGLGAAAYPIRAARAAAAGDERQAAGPLECQWQRAQLPHEIRELGLDDQ